MTNRMTPPKIWYARKLASLRDDGSDPEQLAKDFNLQRLCYEIEKLEEEKVPVNIIKIKTIWERCHVDSDDD